MTKLRKKGLGQNKRIRHIIPFNTTHNLKCFLMPLKIKAKNSFERLGGKYNSKLFKRENILN